VSASLGETRYADAVNHPRMTSSGRRIAFFLGVLIAFMLPKRVECGSPDAQCVLPGDRCTPYEVEPWGFYLLELLVHRDVGFAYKSGADCR